jgi:hypothetical protein
MRHIVAASLCDVWGASVSRPAGRGRRIRALRASRGRGMTSALWAHAGPPRSPSPARAADERVEKTHLDSLSRWRTTSPRWPSHSTPAPPASSVLARRRPMTSSFRAEVGYARAARSCTRCCVLVSGVASSCAPRRAIMRVCRGLSCRCWRPSRSPVVPWPRGAWAMSGRRLGRARCGPCALLMSGDPRERSSLRRAAAIGVDRRPPCRRGQARGEDQDGRGGVFTGHSSRGRTRSRCSAHTPRGRSRAWR